MKAPHSPFPISLQRGPKASAFPISLPFPFPLSLLAGPQPPHLSAKGA